MIILPVFLQMRENPSDYASSDLMVLFFYSTETFPSPENFHYHNARKPILVHPACPPGTKKTTPQLARSFTTIWQKAFDGADPLWTSFEKWKDRLNSQDIVLQTSDPSLQVWRVLGAPSRRQKDIGVTAEAVTSTPLAAAIVLTGAPQSQTRDWPERPSATPRGRPTTPG